MIQPLVKAVKDNPVAQAEWNESGRFKCESEKAERKTSR